MKSKIYMMLAICASFVGMTHAKLEAVSQVPPLLVVSCVRGAINSVTLSTNTIATALDIAISSEAGPEQQLIGLVEWNATKQSTDALGLGIVQIVNRPDLAPGPNSFPAYTETCGNQNTGIVNTRWQAIQIYSNVDPNNTTPAAVYVDSAILARQNISQSYGATLLKQMTDTYCGQIGILCFYAVDDINNSVSEGTYRANFMIAFSANIL